jgi:uncharacterized protein
MAESFVGAGIAFPARFDASGALALASNDTEIRESIHLILGTSPGERPMRPEFGCRLQDHLFDPADGTTAGLMAQEVRRALRMWEPRIDLESVEVSVDPEVGNCMWIEVVYQVRGTNDPRNLVFPFYVIPEEPA